MTETESHSIKHKAINHTQW